MSQLKRKFFSGTTLQQALTAAACEFGISPAEVAYKKVEKRHGFLRSRKRVLIEVNVDSPRLQGEALASAKEEDPLPVAVRRPAAIPYKGTVATAGERKQEDTPEDDSPDDDVLDDDVLDDDSRHEHDAEDGDVGEDDFDDDDLVDEDEGLDGEADEDDLGGDDLDDDDLDDADFEDDLDEDDLDGDDLQDDDLDEDDFDEDDLDEDDLDDADLDEDESEDDAYEDEILDGEDREEEELEEEDLEEEDLEDEGDDFEEDLSAAEEAMERLLAVAGLDLDMEIRETEERIEVDLDGEDAELLLREHGKALFAIEHLLPRVIRGLSGESVFCNVDCQGFREKRRQELVELAETAAEEVLDNGEPKTLELLNPAERRIVHMTLADNPDVETESEGRGYLKRLTVWPS